MTFRQFAFNNVIRNKRIYLAHFLSCSFSVLVFFVYALLLFHPDLQGELRATSHTISQLATIGMRISQIFIFIFSFFFCLYSVGVFLQTRKREFGILMIHGMSLRQLHRLIFLENVFNGGASIVTGIAVGLIFTKLILLAISKMLVIRNGLTFYMPGQAILMTVAAFVLLFGIVALFTARIIKVGRLADLLRSQEKPKPEPVPSALLSVLSVVLILAGYGSVMYFVLHFHFSFELLFIGVCLVTIGTYFLFAQLSVYVLRSLKAKERLLFRGTNLMTISQLIYRMKDNATMFFMITIVSSVAFTGIGTVLAMGHPALKEMENPYAFTYKVDLFLPQEKQHIALIKKQLDDHGFAYDLHVVHAKRLAGRLLLVKQSEFSALARTLGLKEEGELAETESLLLPGGLYEATQIKEKKANVPTSLVLLSDETWKKEVTVKRYVPTVILPGGKYTVIVSDRSFDTAPQIEDEQLQFQFFYVPNWQDTRDVARLLADAIGKDEHKRYEFDALVLDWLNDKQSNGLHFIIGVMVGVVFFTFAASLLYFRFYADMDQDREQYEMISKMGLLKWELRRVVTRQLLLMFFLPIVLAFLHSGVAFFALQQLIDFSVLPNSVLIFLSFIAIQFVYFLAIRWHYLKHMNSRF